MTESTRRRVEKLQRAEKRLLSARLKYLELSREKGTPKRTTKKKQKVLKLSRESVSPVDYQIYA